MNLSSLLSTAAVAIFAIPAIAAQSVTTQPAQTAPKSIALSTADTAIIFKQAPSYPLAKCVVCDKPLPMPPVQIFDYVKNARLFRLDAEGCKAAIDANPAPHIKKIDDAVIVAQKTTYPLKVSPISGKPIDASAVDYVWGTRLVRLAATDEVPVFQKDPATPMNKIDASIIEAQLATYPLKTCAVCNADLTKATSPVNYVYGVKLVRFCAPACVKTFEGEPAKFSRAVNLVK